MIEQTREKSERAAPFAERAAEDKAYEDNSQSINADTGGLSEDEVQKRLEKNGYNELIEKKQNPILKLLSYFWGPIPWMIEIAAALSAVVGHWTDFYIVMALLILNAVVGFWEEHQAGNAISALKSHLAVKARVKRSGTWQQVPARELVPGDLLRLRSGDVVPADVKLAEDEQLKVDQSALTGESLPVDKGRNDTLYSSSIVKKG